MSDYSDAKYKFDLMVASEKKSKLKSKPKNVPKPGAAKKLASKLKSLGKKATPAILLEKQSARDLRFESAFPVPGSDITDSAAVGISKLLYVATAVYSAQRKPNASRAIELAESLLTEFTKKLPGNAK